MRSLLAAVRAMVAKGVAQDEARPEHRTRAERGPSLGWIDREKEFPTRTSNMLNPDKYEPAFGEWHEDLMPHLEAIIDGPPRHILFGMLSSGAGVPYCQEWHRATPVLLARWRAPSRLCSHTGPCTRTQGTARTSPRRTRR